MRSGPAALALTLSVAACEAAGPGVGEGRIEITVGTDVAAPAGAGYTLSLNGGDSRLLGTAGSVVYTGVPAGTHTVLLFGIPEGCQVAGVNPRAVSVAGNGTVAVRFEVACPPPLVGGFQVQITTTGEPLDPNGYGLDVAGAPLRAVAVNTLERFDGLEPGRHLVGLKDVIPQCRLEGGNPQSFTVVPAKAVLVRLRVTCGGT